MHKQNEKLLKEIKTHKKNNKIEILELEDNLKIQ